MLTRRDKGLKLPRQRRKYYEIYQLDGGLRYDVASTVMEEKYTPRCEEVVLQDNIVKKAHGTAVYGQTTTYPLDGTIMNIYHYKKADGTDKLVVHTTTQLYYYDSTTNTFVSLVAAPKNLVCRVSVIILGSKNLVCRITRVPNTPATKDLVSRVTVKVYDVRNLHCGITVTS